MTAIQSPVLPYTAHVQEVAERLTGAPQETVRAEFWTTRGRHHTRGYRVAHRRHRTVRYLHTLRTFRLAAA